ncbi:UNVERIFIED_CONTAM: hypothetical protein GTU68_055126 [Idotea baltica]|nr:hypothetical protein [Idotea baltica]
MISAWKRAGLTEAEALDRATFCDQHGLLVNSRTDLMSHNMAYTKDMEQLGFVDAIRAIEPDVLIGATGAGGAFTQEAIDAMSQVNQRPVIFALSNPTSRAECTAEQAYTWSKGEAIFVSGSPFDPVELEGVRIVPGQGNNAYIFPGLGLGLLASRAQRVDDELLIVGAETLAAAVTDAELASGTLYPSLRKIRDVSHSIASRVAQVVFDMGLTKKRRPRNLEERIRKMMYDPRY